MPQESLPVVGGQLAASDVWHRSDPTALVLPVPDGAGHLQHAQDTPVPAARGRHIRPHLADQGPRTQSLTSKAEKWDRVKDVSCGTHIPQPPVTQRCSIAWSLPVLGHHRPAALHTGGTSAPSTWLVATPGLTHWSAHSPEASLTGCGPGFVCFVFTLKSHGLPW